LDEPRRGVNPIGGGHVIENIELIILFLELVAIKESDGKCYF
jgi:hypothetical protein